MAYNPNKYHTWNLTTPNSGLYLNDEFSRIYENFRTIMPVGTIMAWMPGYFTDGSNNGYTPVAIDLPDIWAECNGSELNDADSPIFNGSGRYLPNLTDNRFLMGSNSEGSIGGSNNMIDHTHSKSLTADTGGGHGHGFSLTAAGQTFSGNSGYNSSDHTHSISGGAHSHTYSRAYMHYMSQPVGYPGSAAAHDNLEYSSNSTAYDGAHNHVCAGVSSNHYHNINHTHPASGVSGSIGGSDGTHPHSISGSIGTGAAPSSTENRPSYLAVNYIIRIK